ncbi:cytochrome c oxidase subunit II [Gracilibacillus caseinilyticus]|uniref:Cytochrome c oxidase subunit 2 n=1 Tax=Gracilibacillus caseinilyticus TaxID=2932256 RepID=A0ABY4EUN4_9BACI|nr:cytochrome c oxidase subunit II [Gracilibacillus caseinilyticus]UOQ47989.1 cytochrome c oxidase subunit II [Gracilibacillus caseinilyticus]
MKDWMGKIRTLSIFSFLVMVLTACGKNNLTALVPKGYGAEQSFNVIIISILVMIVVFIVVMAIYIYVVLKFRRKKGQENQIPKQTEGNKTLEVVWTVIPILLLIIIAVPTIASTYDLADEGEKEDSINVNVKGMQFWWNFEYANEEVQTSQELYIPVDQKVYLNMLSGDVIHAFWVPSISGKMDVSPENENTMYIEAFEEGVYWGKCTEFCGDSHSLMDFKIVVVSQEEYDQWIEGLKNTDPEYTAQSASAQEGQQLFNNNCISCHAIDASATNPVIAPNLADFGNRAMIAGVEHYSKEALVDWILNPGEIKPGNGMMEAPYLTDNAINEEDAEKIADFLMELKATDKPVESVEIFREEEGQGN